MLDVMCSMMYGLPQVVDYDTSLPPLDAGVHPAELVHGCPPELQLILADINTRSAWKQIGPILDWYTIERRLREWQPCLQTSKGEDSWKLVARLAVQESWRHTLLTYLYMAVCGAKSNEARVETSVRQVFQIINTVKHEIQPVTKAHFFLQYLIAGAFTPNERYRALARERLSDGIETKVWLMNMSGFVPVLDHLWHGAAANGRPVRWSDYVHSRQAMVPIAV
ncbi:hypothetical protein FRC12_014946 [Ceratobasidium sp. 428]|nr:hypothetical protein FRC12_014946 [Ceratobasidium sp. 428]